MEDQFDPWLKIDTIYCFWNSEEFVWNWDGRSPQCRWSISDGSNSRQVGVWKYGTTLLPPCAAEFCTVLFTVILTDGDVYGEKLQRFCLQQAFLGSLMRFAHHNWANGNISSPTVWWHQCFATFSWRFKLEKICKGVLDFMVWQERSFDDLRHHLWVLGSFTMKIVEFAYVWWCFITIGCWKNRWDEFGISAMP